MKLITNELGRVTRSLVPDEVRPVHGLDTAQLIRLVSERYNFLNQSSLQEAQINGARFQRGSFTSGNKKINIAELAIYNDGFSVTAYDTDMAEFIMEDAFLWAKKTFDFRDPVTEPIVTYENTAVVEFEEPVEKALKIFDGFKGLLEKSFKQTYSKQIPMYFSRFAIGADPRTVPAQLQMRDFVIDRRVGFPYEKNRFYSIAPLPTKEHAKLLEAFERLIAA